MIYEFQATQDLHGYGKPWAGGTNINIYDHENSEIYLRYIRMSEPTLWRSSDDSGSIAVEVEEGKTYSIKAFDPVGNIFRAGLIKLDPDSLIVSDAVPVFQAYNAPNKSSYYTQKTADTDEKWIIVQMDQNVITDDSVQLLICEGDTYPDSYTPYANICMPEGFNIWDPTNQEYIQVYAGYVNANTRELYLRPVYQEYAGEELVGPWMSSLDLYEEDATPTEGAFVIDFGGELTSYEITPFMLQTLLDSLGIRQHFTDGAGLLNKLMDQAQGRVRSEEELLHLSRPLKVIAIGDQLPAGLTFKPISKDVLPGLPGKFIR